MGAEWLDDDTNSAMGCCIYAGGLVSAHADVALFLEEPYGKMGAMDPTGHAAVYLTNVCASSPTRLRRCRPGEVGVVISRYHRVAGYDWLAIPLLGYLYAVDSLRKIPTSADAETVAALRDAYRRAHFLANCPTPQTVRRRRATGLNWSVPSMTASSMASRLKQLRNRTRRSSGTTTSRRIRRTTVYSSPTAQTSLEPCSTFTLRIPFTAISLRMQGLPRQASCQVTR